MTTKTSMFMMILHRVASSPNRCLTELQLKELMGNPTRSTWSRQIGELLEDTVEVPAVLMKTIDSETGETNYCINHRCWQVFVDAHIEGKFLLECYRQTGYLLDSNFANIDFKLPEVDRKLTETLSRKFLNLVKVKSLRTDLSKHVLNVLIEALISQKQVEITYNGGVRILRPYTLLSHRDELYIMGDRKKGESLLEERTYKLTRITGIKILTIGFPYPDKKRWNPEKKFQESSGLILGDVRKVTLKVYGHSRKIISEKEYFNGDLINRDQDFDTYLVSYTNHDEFLGQLFIYCQDIEIVDDDELREAFTEKALGALARNQAVSKKLA